MVSTIVRRVVLASVISAAGCGEVAPGVADASTPAELDASTSVEDGGSRVSFSHDVAPLLARECARCHQTAFQGDFRTADSAYAALLDESRVVGAICNAGETDRLPIVEPGAPDRSGLFRLVAVGYHGCAQVYGMPKSDPRGILIDFDPAGAETIRRWIAEGALRD